MEYFENLSNAIVQFEDGAGFSSASAPPNDIYFAEGHYNKEHDCYQCGKCHTAFENESDANYCCTACYACGYAAHVGFERAQKCCLCNCAETGGGPNGTCADMFGSEEGTTPISEPMELGEMANWTPLDGTPSLKRRKGAETYAAENQVFALTYFIENDVNMDDITDVTEALELYLNLNGDILEMETLDLQKHPYYETANRLLSDLSYRLDELQTQTPNIIPKFELDAEYDAWRSAFTDGAAATQINKYQRGWMQKVMNPRSRQIKSMWDDAEPSFTEELKSAELDEYGLDPDDTFYISDRYKALRRDGLEKDSVELFIERNQLTPDGEGFYISNITGQGSFLDRITPLTWGLGLLGAFFIGKKL